jgi:energy-coupling factor transporter ATP-binding protein EcfA2
MITKIQFGVGFPVEQVYKRPVEFNFTPGFNCFFASNGAGKSVALKFLKSFVGIENAGWSGIVNPDRLASNRLPFGYTGLTPENVYAHVEWDGSPCFYNAGDISVSNTFFYQNVGQSEDGITTEKEQFDALVNKPSSGQYRLQKINKILDMVKKNVPNILEIPSKYQHKGDVRYQIDYIQSLNSQGRITLLLDEPERSLSLPKQKRLLDVLLEFSEEMQIIVACHSPFVLFLPQEKVNIINVEPGYYEECKELFKI